MKRVPKHVHYVGAYLKKGQSLGMKLGGDCSLTGEGGGSCLYIAPVFDSGEEEGSWQSLRIEGEFLDCKLEIVAAASDRDYREALSGEELSPEEKEELLRSLEGIRRVNAQDILLTGLKGRYLYMLWKVSGQEKCRFRIRGAAVEFPRNSFLEYFPEVYQTEDDFFERYISIFQSMYLDLEREIDHIPERLDYEKADLSDLMMLADWAGLGEALVSEAVRDQSADRLRRLIAHAQELQAGKGTAKALRLALELLYGRRIHLLEYFKWYEYVSGRQEELKLYRRLYGSDSRTLTILIEEPEGAELSEADKKGMRRVIREMIPMGTKLSLVSLKESFHMDAHCYLDCNSVMASPAAANVGDMELYGNLILQ